MRDVHQFKRLVTIQWSMKILWELYDFKDRDLQLALKRVSLFGGATWDEIEKNPVQAVIVLLAFMRTLARYDDMLEDMIESFINESIFDAFIKADKRFEYWSGIYGKSVFLKGLNLV